MAEPIKAGIVLKVRFQQAEAKEFTGYIDYIARDEAQRNEHFQKFSMYNDYMDNPEKTTALFTSNSDSLDDTQKKLMKKEFEKAQANGSLMWQNVISFDNRWLAQHGLYDSKTGALDEKKMKEVTRACMGGMLEKEKMKNSGLWTASIHYNTDNVHVHIALVEPIPTRTRGKLKPTTLTAMKSKVYKNIQDKSEFHQRINSLIRDNMVAGKKAQGSTHDRQMKKLFLEIYRQLPPDKRMWQYSMNAISHIRPLIDELSTLYINKYHKKDFQELQQKLSAEENELKLAFGTGKSEEPLYKNFSKNRIQDLYTRMGNSILKECKDYDREVKQNRTRPSNGKHTQFYQKYIDYRAINLLRKMMKKDFESIKNQNAYEQMMEEIERGEQR